ncbi:phosphatidylethanolamine-binding protein [Xylogone sp. PMI_703]|nr:phosphatidylethanolamine-binding protein [Xylogone sp. PMI_703]
MALLERTISLLLKNVRNHDSGLFTRSPAFSSFLNPTITITSPDCGPSNTNNDDNNTTLLDIDHTQDGKDLLPTLHWTIPSTITESSIQSFLLIIEDADAPLWKPILHAGFFNIPSSVREFGEEDLLRDTWDESGNTADGKVAHEVGYAKTMRGKVYAGPRPLRGHGRHRYFFQVVALGGKVQLGRAPKREEILEEVERRGVLGWGEWVGIAERV